jgi:hypothetical protein
MTSLERRGRLLLRAYPAAYRAQRGEEIIGTLLEATPAGRRSPTLRDGAALLIGGLRARVGQYRGLGAAASMRQAALLAAAIYLGFAASDYLPSGLTLPGLILVSASLLPWLVGAIAASGAVAYLSWTFPAAPPREVWPSLAAILLPLVALAVLARDTGRLPRAWACLPGVAAVADLAGLAAPAFRWYALDSVPTMQNLLIIGMVVIALGWIAVDARPALGLAIVLGFSVLTTSAKTLTLWLPRGFPMSNASILVAQLEARWVWLACPVVLAVLALWRLRSQAVRQLS